MRACVLAWVYIVLIPPCLNPNHHHQPFIRYLFCAPSKNTCKHKTNSKKKKNKNKTEKFLVLIFSAHTKMRRQMITMVADDIHLFICTHTHKNGNKSIKLLPSAITNESPFFPSIITFRWAPLFPCLGVLVLFYL